MYQVISLAEFEAQKGSRLLASELTPGNCTLRHTGAELDNRQVAVEAFVEIVSIKRMSQRTVVFVKDGDGTAHHITLDSDSFILGRNRQPDSPWLPVGYLLAFSDWDSGLAELSQRQLLTV